jgi:hypothetical protein
VDVPTTLTTLITTSVPSTITLEGNTRTPPTPTKTEIVKGTEKTAVVESSARMFAAPMGVMAVLAAVAGWVGL